MGSQRDLLSRIKAVIRSLAAKIRLQRPGMIGTPPSQRPLWHDPAAHARSFAQRYAEPLNFLVENRMMELGINPLQIGVGDPEHGIRHAAFLPHEAGGGGNAPDGKLNLDSGILNPELFQRLGSEAADAYAKARLRDRIDAGIAHEYEEAKGGGSHEYAYEHAPETQLPIRPDARAGPEDQGRRALAQALIHSSRRSQPAWVKRNADSGPPAHVETGYMIRAATSSR